MWGRSSSSADDGRASGGGGDLASRYNLAHIRQLYEQLQRNRQSHTYNEPEVVEAVRVTAELLLYGEAVQSDLMFEFFGHQNMMVSFIQMAREPRLAVQVQVIQTLTLLLFNVKRDEVMGYLLSNNFINELLSFDFDFEVEELRDPYINLLRTIGMRMTARTAPLFLDMRHTGLAHCPLFKRALHFWSHPERLARNAARVVALSLYKVDEPDMRRYLISDACRLALFREVISGLKRHCNGLFIPLRDFTLKKRGAVDTELADLQDELCFVQDLFDAGIRGLNEPLALHVMENFVTAVLVPGMLVTRQELGQQTTSKAAEEEGPNGSPALSAMDGDGSYIHQLGSQSPSSADLYMFQQVALFILAQVFAFITHPCLTRLLTLTLLHPLDLKLIERPPHSSSPSPSLRHPSPPPLPPHPNPVREKLWECLSERQHDGLVLTATLLLHRMLRNNGLLRGNLLALLGFPQHGQRQDIAAEFAPKVKPKPTHQVLQLLTEPLGESAELGKDARRPSLGSSPPPSAPPAADEQRTGVMDGSQAHRGEPASAAAVSTDHMNAGDSCSHDDDGGSETVNEDRGASVGGMRDGAVAVLHAEDGRIDGHGSLRSEKSAFDAIGDDGKKGRDDGRVEGDEDGGEVEEEVMANVRQALFDDDTDEAEYFDGDPMPCSTSSPVPFDPPSSYAYRMHTPPAASRTQHTSSPSPAFAVVNVLGYRSMNGRAGLAARRGSLRTGTVMVRMKDVIDAELDLAMRALSVLGSSSERRLATIKAVSAFVVELLRPTGRAKLQGKARESVADAYAAGCKALLRWLVAGGQGDMLLTAFETVVAEEESKTLLSANPPSSTTAYSLINNSSILWSAAPRVSMDALNALPRDLRTPMSDQDVMCARVRGVLALRQLFRSLCLEAPSTEADDGLTRVAAVRLSPKPRAKAGATSTPNHTTTSSTDPTSPPTTTTTSNITTNTPIHPRTRSSSSSTPAAPANPASNTLDLTDMEYVACVVPSDFYSSGSSSSSSSTHPRSGVNGVAEERQHARRDSREGGAQGGQHGKDGGAEQLQQEQLYFVVHPELFLLAAPDRTRLSVGQVVCAVPLHHVDVTVDKTSLKTLKVTTLFDDKLGLMRLKVYTDPRLSQSRPLWHLTLDFDNAPNCQVVKNQVEGARMKIRRERRDALKSFLNESLRSVQQGVEPPQGPVASEDGAVG